MPRNPYRFHVASLAVVAVLAVAGCSGDEPTAAPPGTLTPPTTPSTPSTERPPDTTARVDDEEAAVLAAVDCYWTTIIEANDPPDPEHPGFEQCFTGDALERSRGNVAARAARGEWIEETDGIVDRVILGHNVDEDTGWMRICVVDDSIVRNADGIALDDSIQTLEVQLGLRKQDQAWKVESNQVLGRQEGMHSCGAP